MITRPFHQVDVFSELPFSGNPLAVVLDGAGLTAAEMQRFANWTNLSETTFVLPPTRPEAHYRVRIFTTSVELPFAGHPTLGTCHAWLSTAGVDVHDTTIVQECAAGLIRVQRGPERLAFAAPPLVRSGPADEATIGLAANALGIDVESIEAVEWVDNGPGWLAVLLRSADEVLAVRCAATDLKLGVVGPYPPGGPAAIEVRAFFPDAGVVTEDPVTGSLNASLAVWLLDTQRVSAPYVARQGTILGRHGRVHVSEDTDGTVWIGGATTTTIRGTVGL